MAKTLADGKTKFTILTAAPANPAAPTASELNDGIDLSCDILKGDFTWTAADSDTVTDQDPLCAKNNSVTYGASNYTTGFTLFRYVDAGEDGWEAVQEKGTEIWGYARETEKDSTEDWSSGDEIYLGGRVQTDTPQRLDGTGFIRRRIPLGPQRMYDNITVASGGGGGGGQG